MGANRLLKFLLLIVGGLAIERFWIAPGAPVEAAAARPPAPASVAPSPAASPPPERSEALISAIADQNKRLDAVLTGLTSLLEEIRRRASEERTTADLATQEIVLRELTSIRNTLETRKEESDQDLAQAGR